MWNWKFITKFRPGKFFWQIFFCPLNWVKNTKYLLFAWNIYFSRGLVSNSEAICIPMSKLTWNSEQKYILKHLMYLFSKHWILSRLKGRSVRHTRFAIILLLIYKWRRLITFWKLYIKINIKYVYNQYFHMSSEIYQP